MRNAKLMLGVFALLAILVGVFAAEDVVTLGGKDFDKFIKKNDFVVVEFYAPWCGHCKSLAPEYEKAAGMLKKEKVPVVLAKVDATQADNEFLATKYDIKGYPSLKIFRNGDLAKPADFDGPREAVGIVAYLKRMTGPASLLFGKPAELKAYIEATPDYTLLGVFPGGEKSAEFKNYLAAAEKLRAEHTLAHVFKASDVPDGLCDKVSKDGCAGAGTLLVVKTYDEPVTLMSLDAKTPVEEMNIFVEVSTTPLVVELNADSIHKKALQKMFDKPEIPKVLVFVDRTKGDEDYQSFRSTILELKTEYEGKLNFLIVDSTNGGALNFFGVTGADMPAAAIHAVKPVEEKFVGKNIKTGAELRAWLESYFTGKLPKFIKSDPLPTETTGPVTVLVSSIMDEVIFKSGKDVLVEFYAPWCGHCKKLAPIYDELAESFKEDEQIVIAKMDTTTNDVTSDRFDIKGFPTLYFYQAGTDTLMLFSGERTLEGFQAFIAKNRSSAVKKDEL